MHIYNCHENQFKCSILKELTIQLHGSLERALEITNIKRCFRQSASLLSFRQPASETFITLVNYDNKALILSKEKMK